jgi:pimeloyl-ACP methyl ester carboxylesterase
VSRAWQLTATNRSAIVAFAVRAPALVIHGDTDKPVPVETSGKVLAERIPDARLVVVQDTGHFPHMEKPEIVNEAIWQWLEEKMR